MESKLQTIHEDIFTNPISNTKPNNYPEVNAYLIRDAINSKDNKQSNKALIILEYKHTNRMTSGVQIPGKKSDKPFTITSQSYDISAIKDKISASRVPSFPHTIHYYEKTELNGTSQPNSNFAGNKSPTTSRSLFTMNGLTANTDMNHVLLITSPFDQDTDRYPHIHNLDNDLHQREINSFISINSNLGNVTLYIKDILAKLYGLELLQKTFKEVNVIDSSYNIYDTLIYDYWGYQNGSVVIPSTWTVHPDPSTCRFIRTFKSSFTHVEGTIEGSERTGHIQYRQEIKDGTAFSLFIIEVMPDMLPSFTVSHTDNPQDSQMTIKSEEFNISRPYIIDINPVIDSIKYLQKWEDAKDNIKTHVVEDDKEEESERQKLCTQFKPLVQDITTVDDITRYDIYKVFDKIHRKSIDDIMSDKQVVSTNFKNYIKILNHIIKFATKTKSTLRQYVFEIIIILQDFKLKKKSDIITETTNKPLMRQNAQQRPVGRSITSVHSNNDNSD
jgi:hypothetical protein